MKYAIAFPFVFAVLVMTSVSRADTITWRSTTGGDLAAVDNWGGTLPNATSDEGVVDTAQSGPFTLSRNFSPYRLRLKAKNAAYEFDPGAGFSLLATHRIWVDNSATLTVRSGTIGIAEGGDRFFLGDNVTHPNCKMIVTGPGACVRSGQNGASYFGIGQNAPGCTLVITNGALLDGNVRMGANSAEACGGSLIVTGHGSRWVNTNFFNNTIGMAGGQQLVLVTDGGLLTNSASFHIGYKHLDSTKNTFLGGSRVVITNGGSAFFGGDLFVGEYSPSNTLAIADGGRAFVPVKFSVGENTNTFGNGIFVSGSGVLTNTWNNNYVGVYGNGNFLTAENGGRIFLLGGTGTTMIGGKAFSSENKIIARTGGRVEMMQNISVGMASGCVENGIECVDGGVVTMADHIITVGANAASVSNYVDVAEGGVFSLTNSSFYLGYPGSFSRLSVRDGGLFAATAGVISVGLQSTASNTCFSVDGGEVRLENTALRIGDKGSVGSRMTVRNGGHVILSNLWTCVIGEGSADFDRSKDNCLEVLEGGHIFIHLRLTDPYIAVSAYGEGNGIVVDGGVFEAPGCKIMCGPTAAENCRSFIRVANGGILRARRLLIGDWGHSCTGTFVNGTVELNEFNLGYNDTASNAVVRIVGTNTQIRVKTLFNARKDNGSRFEFDIPAEGYKAVPFRCQTATSSDIYFNAPVFAVRVDRAFALRGGGRVVLLESEKVDLDVSSVRFELPPEVRLDLSNPRQIAVRVPSLAGTRILLR